ncbi:MAG: cation:proton antiporter, partial [Chloroflexota bacterium]
MALFSLVSERLERTAATGPMLFMLFGLAVSPHGFGIVDLDLDNELALTLAEVTLVLLLFTDASRIDLRVFRGAVGAPLRLLAIALPLIVLGGAAAAVWLFGMGIWEAAALATVLAPTDAALGQAVVTDPRVPARIRQALNVEAGLNDGLNLPLLTIALALAASAGGAAEAADGLLLVGRQIGLGVLIGAAVGLASGWLIDRAASAEWVNTTFQRIAALAVPLFS